MDISQQLDVLEREHQRELDSHTVGWLVCSKDLGDGSLYLIGLYATRGEAQAAANAHLAEIERFTQAGEPGWQVTAERVVDRTRGEVKL